MSSYSLREFLNMPRLFQAFANRSFPFLTFPILTSAYSPYLMQPRDDHFARTTLAGRSASGSTCAISGYMRFRDGRHPNLEFFADAAPPPTLNDTLTTWVPTLEYTVHSFANTTMLQAPLVTYPTAAAAQANSGSTGTNTGWVRFIFRSPIVRQGLVSTDGELWSNESFPRILARSRQLARHLLPKPKK